MREYYQKQLEGLHNELIRMGALCEEAVAGAVMGLLEEDGKLRQKVINMEKEIDLKEREIESICVRLLLREQPVAGDLRQITAAQRIVSDMERIGDQAADIARLAEVMYGEGSYSAGEIEKTVKSGVYISDMSLAITKMLSASVDSFVHGDLQKAREVIKMDDAVDNFFVKVKHGLIKIIKKDSKTAGACLDILMIAKYLERSGDHAVNIAKWVAYSITGERGAPV
ncbi:MAG: phosphate signaling complex protein PhoU [Spirochaetaceae bacterium]|jgi:phosphate transport system protein|nr:phosphate signaling complex protein PhoU [Spirochaetaceae bacterium]